MDFQDVIFGFLSAVAAFFVARFAMTLASVLRHPLWQIKATTLASWAQLDADQQDSVDELRNLGFEPKSMAQFKGGPINFKGLLFQHENREVFAFLSFAPTFPAGFAVEFFSFASDGKVLLTFNRARLLPPAFPPAVIAIDASAASLDDQWKYHIRRMEGISPDRLDAEEANRIITGLLEGELEHLIASGGAVKGRDGAWHLSLRPAIRMAWRLAKLKSDVNKPYHSSLMAGPNRSLFFARAYVDTEALRARQPPRHIVTAAIFVVTLVLSLIFWGSATTWGYAAILTVVLLVHEAGHAVAMLVFGYRDIRVFFIPFFGAAVTGSTDEIPAWKQIVILLAGPLPGILAGSAFLIYRGLHPFESGYLDISRIALIAIIINLANLLPFTPLDGGRLLEIAVFNRWPRARAIFSIASVAALLALSALLRDPLLLSGVVFVGFYSLNQWRVMKLQSAWLPGLDKRDQLVRLFETAREKFGTQSFGRHYVLVKTIFEQGKVLPPRLPDSVAVLSLLVAVWLGAGTATFAIWRQTHPAARAYVDHRSSPQKVFDEAVEAYLYDDDQNVRNLTAIEKASERLEQSDKRRGDVTALKAFELPPSERMTVLESLLEQRLDGNAFGPPQLAREILWTATQENESRPIEQQINALRSALDRVSSLWPDNVPTTATYRISLARLLDKRGDHVAALRVIQEVQANLRAAQAPPRLLAEAIRAEAWHDISQQEPAKAVAVLESELSEELKQFPETLRLDEAWAYIFAGDLATGSETMRLAAYVPAPQPTFLQQAFGIKPRPRLVHPLDLAYVMLQEKRGQEAATLIGREYPRVCKLKLEPISNDWEAGRDWARHEAFEFVCPGGNAPPKS